MSEQTVENRREVAKKVSQGGALNALPKVTHGSEDRPLRIGNIEIPCYVLEGGIRVIVQQGILSGLGMSRGGSEGGGERLAHFAGGRGISPFISNALSDGISSPILFVPPHGGRAFGYPATILADICEAILSARAAGVLHARAAHIGHRAEILVRGFARAGITALVDEATGYQAEREQFELQKLLAVYLSAERLKWAQRFPREFYKQIFRLKGWHWPPNGNRMPRTLGHITNQLVYERLPQGVLDKLREMNPVDGETGRRRHRHHQFLSENVGQDDLYKHLLQLMALLKGSRSWPQFQRLLAEVFPRSGSQCELLIEEPVDR